MTRADHLVIALAGITLVCVPTLHAWALIPGVLSLAVMAVAE